MKIWYEPLFPGQVPFTNAVRSRAVHVWYPLGYAEGLEGWVRQKDPVKPKGNDRNAQNAYVPLLNIETPGFEDWVKSKAALLNPKRGFLAIWVRYADEIDVNFGMWWDNRPLPKGPVWKGDQMSKQQVALSSLSEMIDYFQKLKHMWS